MARNKSGAAGTWCIFITVAALFFIDVHGSRPTNRLFEWTRHEEDYASEGKMLTGHSFVEFSHKFVSSQCAMECLRHSQCKSFNFHHNSARCELNTATHQEFPSHIVDNTNTEYHVRDAFSIDPDALGPCATDPCNGRGYCIERKNKADDLVALCICHEGWAGSHCQKQAHAVDWGPWEDWGQCSVTCGHGWHMRKRKCVDQVTQKVVSELECYGADVEYGVCVLQDCPRWEAWGEWETCSTSQTCGLGVKLRHRECANGGVPGVDRYCLGSVSQSTPCQGIDCRGAMRLEGSTEHGEGRLEIYNDITGEWGKVCANQLTPKAADLACRQMGFPGAHAVVGNGQFKEAAEDGPFALTDIACQGDERSLLQCPHNLWALSGSCSKGASVAAGVQCNVDGAWSLWSPWGECSVTCENGTRQRTRSCSHPPQKHEGKPCEGEKVQHKPCTLEMCPSNGTWGEWQDWSTCNAQCGYGTQSRVRTCISSQPCVGPSTSTQECYAGSCAVDGVWREWSDWGACSVTCGNGTQLRSRTCNGPYHGGADCVGNSTDSRHCRPRMCPVDGHWMDWEAWSACTRSCGGGSRTRSRECYHAQHGGKNCDGHSNETEDCQTQGCPVDGVWLEWAEWSQCSHTCGNGSRVRARSCQGPFHGGANCTGPWDQTENCNPEPCPVDGVWEDWSTWSVCTVTCGGGTTIRTRNCTGPFHGGAACAGSATETQPCNVHHCPVDGYYEEWSPWSACSVSCGGGSQERNRTCVMPEHGGNPCQGEANQTQACNNHHCPVDGYYHDWSDWSTCSLTCGGGQQWRHRVCEPPKHGGKNCSGPDNATQDCNTKPCPIDGVWKDWSDWSSCNTTCGGGMRERVRVCEEPKHGGKPCEGRSAEYLPCADNPCPIPGDWFDWTQWTQCTVTCGGGTRNRSRTCDMTSYGNLTAPCEGDSDEMGDCHTFACQPYARTCTEWQERGLTVSTEADIDPDGEEGSLEPVVITCDFDDIPGEAVTVIGHDSERRTRVQGWEGAREYEQEIKYNISFNHVVAIIDQSAHCRQYIRWECKAALIHNFNDNNKVTTGWMNRTERLADYFGGAEPGSSACACGMTNNCTKDKPDLLCNCDANDATWRSDEGDLTFKDDLPVTAFVAGDTGQPDKEYGYHTIGKLKCHGSEQESSQTVSTIPSAQANEPTSDKN